MPHLIPVLDFAHEMRLAGLPVEYGAVLSDVQGHWDLLPPDRRTRLLLRAGAPRTAPATGRIDLVLRRGRNPTVENLYLSVDQGERQHWSTAWRRWLHVPFTWSGEKTEAAATARAAFEEASWSRGRTSILGLCDAMWGEGTYDEKVDGPLVELTVPTGCQEIERYWVEEPFALVLVLRDPDRELVYHIVEPELYDLERALVATINDRLRDVLILENDVPERRAVQLLSKVFELLRIYRGHCDRRTAYRIAYYFLRNYLGLGRLEPIVRDGHIEDISCNGPNIPVFVAHDRHQNLRTNLVFDEMELNSFTIKLAQRGGKLLSVSQPLVDATLPEGSRIQAALGREVTSRGSAFTIRKFREDPLTAVDLIRSGTHSLDTMALLWLAVEARRSLLIMGATASGKTTTLNCLSQFIPPAVKVVSIEDTREITLQHENWLAAITRDGFSGNPSDGITMYDLLRAALRQRPEYLLVGEIRGQEGLTLFQAMATGHTCFSTMHAGSVENAVYRLENAPINVPRVMLTSLDFALLQGQVEVNGRQVRRMLSLTELNGIDSQTRNLRTSEIYHWDPATDTHNATATSIVLEQTRQRLGWTRTRFEDDLAERRAVLDGLVAKNERHYRDVAREVRRFYARRGAVEIPSPVPVTVPVQAPQAPVEPPSAGTPPRRARGLGRAGRKR